MNRSEKYSEIRRIADEVCNQTVTAEQAQQLEVLLKGDREGQRFYQDYIEMHVHMLDDMAPDFDVIRRRTLIDEVIVRPHENLNLVDKESSSKLPSSFWTYTIGILLLISVVILTLFLVIKSETGDYIGKIESGRLAIEKFGGIESQQIILGEYQAQQPTEISLNSGDRLRLGDQSRVKFYNSSEVALYNGSLSLLNATGKNITILSDAFKVNSHGFPLQIDLKNKSWEVTSGGNGILIPKRWRPIHYWSFDSDSDRVIDHAGYAMGIPGAGVKRIKGLVGSGAFSFDNSVDARINVGSGGGTVPASGSFSVVDGVTIEALVIPEYSGEKIPGQRYGEIDEIFRKDQSDKDHRLLLSFQNDSGKEFLRPLGDFAESISFGLYILGQGYHELKLPLDGKNNRPTLAQLKDGNFHHVVATYDVRTGLKAIYLDGEMLASYQYPTGSKMLSGGAGLANIGNSPNATGNDGEAYAGVIDEVAFYDFALPDYMVKQHYQFVLQGRNYFGQIPSPQNLPYETEIKMPALKTLVLDSTTGLPKSIAK